MRIWRTKTFKRDAKKLGLRESEIEEIEQEIASDPEAGDEIQGLKGARKLRFAFGNKGKRGGGRVIFVLIVREDTAYLLMAYGKSEKDDLNKADRAAIVTFIEEVTGHGEK